MYVEDFEIDEDNEQEMARHGVLPEDLFEILDSGRFRVVRNKRPHSIARPYV